MAETVDILEENVNAGDLMFFLVRNMQKSGVVYVTDVHGNPLKSARIVRRTLTDGSKVDDLILDFHFA